MPEGCDAAGEVATDGEVADGPGASADVAAGSGLPGVGFALLVLCVGSGVGVTPFPALDVHDVAAPATASVVPVTMIERTTLERTTRRTFNPALLHLSESGIGGRFSSPSAVTSK